MKKALVIAIMAALSSSYAFSENTPDNVGNVTIAGNIVANSPMWQWTVNDYAGSRLDAKPSDAKDVGGKKVYPLNGQAFIAVSGYLPSFSSISYDAAATVLGNRDVTKLTDMNGNYIANITNLDKGSLSFTIAAKSQNSNGKEVNGTLKLSSSELRGYKYAFKRSDDTIAKRSAIFGHTAPVTADVAFESGSCFVGTGSFSSSSSIVSGTTNTLSGGEGSATAFAAYNEAINRADASGNTVKLSTITTTDDKVSNEAASCRSASAVPYALQNEVNDRNRSIYIASAHVLELKPLELTFDEPVSGVWNATLTVTAYQM